MSSVRDKLAFVSHFSGYLRVRAETFRVLPEVGGEVVEHLSAERGVRCARFSPVTGSLLVTYDPDELEVPRLVAQIIRLGGLHGIALDAPAAGDLPPSAGERLRHGLAAMNRRLRERTAGHVDLKFALPAVLSGTGLLVLLGGRRRVPEWYDLMFWAFVTFCNLNPPAGASARAVAVDDAGARR